MPNPLSSPKSSDRDALRDLEQHPGYVLLMKRLAEDTHNASLVLQREEGLQDVGRAQGQVRAFREAMSLRERMIAELEAELRNFEAGDAHRKADAAFGITQ